MQTANIFLAIGGDTNNLVPKYDVTAAEVAVLRHIHGDGAVSNVEVNGSVTRTHRQEIGRLKSIYGKWEGERRVSPAVDALFPGAAARVHEDFAELELPEELYAAETRKTANDPLDHDGDGRKGGSLPAEDTDDLDKMTVNQLRNHADKTGVDLTGVTLKADILEAIRLHESQNAEPADESEDEADDEVGEIKDGMFE